MPRGRKRAYSRDRDSRSYESSRSRSRSRRSRSRSRRSRSRSRQSRSRSRRSVSRSRRSISRSRRSISRSRRSISRSRRSISRSRRSISQSRRSISQSRRSRSRSRRSISRSRRSRSRSYGRDYAVKKNYYSSYENSPRFKTSYSEATRPVCENRATQTRSTCSESVPPWQRQREVQYLKKQIEERDREIKKLNKTLDTFRRVVILEKEQPEPVTQGAASDSGYCILPPPLKEIPRECINIPPIPSKGRCFFCERDDHWSYLCTVYCTLEARRNYIMVRRIPPNSSLFNTDRPCRWLFCGIVGDHIPSLCPLVPYPVTQAVVQAYWDQLRQLKIAMGLIPPPPQR